MKQLTLLALALLLCSGSLLAQAQPQTQQQDTSYWEKKGNFSVNFSQVDLVNWSGGGNSSVAVGTLFSFQANYEKAKNTWENKLDMSYGVLRQGDNDQKFVKTDDAIILISKYGHKLKKNIYVSGIVDFRTQFNEGIQDVDGRDSVISRFMAPGFLLANVGITYKYKKMFSATFSPLSSKTTFVRDDTLAALGAYGVEPGENTRFEGGVNFKAAFDKEILTNTTFTSNLNLFADYKDLAEIDVNWENALVLKVNKWLASSITTQLIYDEDIKSKEIENSDGTTRLAPGTQFKSVINVGVTLLF